MQPKSGNKSSDETENLGAASVNVSSSRLSAISANLLESSKGTHTFNLIEQFNSSFDVIRSSVAVSEESGAVL